MATPTGYTGQTALVMVRNRCNAPTVPSDGVIISFLNAGIEQVETELGGIIQQANIPVVANQQVVALPADMQEYIDINYSQTLPTSQNATIYPIAIVGQDFFYEATGWSPATGSGNPYIAFIQSDQNGIITINFYAGALLNGFINVLYYQRPTLWTGNDANGTNLSSEFQEAAILWACMNTCENLQKYGQPMKFYQDQYDKMMAKFRVQVKKRNQPKRGQVRNVMDVNPNPLPYWIGG